jgi:hypothetical protein
MLNTSPLCLSTGCTSLARGRGLCKKHGGSPMCAEPGCGKVAAKGSRCVAHGGGRRCSMPGCTTGARSTRGSMYCRKHGGGRRCSELGCRKPHWAKGLCYEHVTWSRASKS